jgi:hypothetical protein
MIRSSINGTGYNEAQGLLEQSKVLKVNLKNNSDGSLPV